MLETAEETTLETTMESERFDQGSIALHWLTVFLIIVLFASAWSREALDHDTRLASALMTAHRTTGVVTWIVGWVRLVWRQKVCLPTAVSREHAETATMDRWISGSMRLESGLLAISD